MIVRGSVVDAPVAVLVAAESSPNIASVAMGVVVLSMGVGNASGPVVPVAVGAFCGRA